MTPTQLRAYEMHQRGLGYRAIAQELAVSESRVSQLVLRARHLIEHRDGVNYDCSICLQQSGTSSSRP